MSNREEEAITSTTDLINAATTVVAGAEKTIEGLVKFFDGSSHRVWRIASKAAAVSRSLGSVKWSARAAVSQVVVYLESIGAFALAFTSERMADISADLVQRSHHRLLANFLNEVGRRLEAIDTQYEIAEKSLRDVHDRCNEGREQCQLAKASARKEKAVTQGVGGVTAAAGYATAIGCVIAGIFTGGVGTVVGLAIGGTAGAAVGATATAITVINVEEIDGLIGDLSAIESPFKSLHKCAREFQDILLATHAILKSYCREVDQLSMIESNDHYDWERINQCLIYLTIKAESLQRLYVRIAPRIQRLVVRL